MLTGMLSGMVKDASPERIASFLNTCSSGSFGTFLPQVVERLAPDGGISKLKTGLQLLESAKSRGLDVNQGVLTLFPWLFEIVRSEGVVQMEQAAAVISTSQLRFNSEAMAKFVEAYVRTDPQMAFEFVGNLPAETRASSVEAAARMLAMTNPESATDLAFNGNLTGEDQVTVMFQLHVAVGGPHGNYELFERTGSWLKANNKDVSKVDDRVGRPLPPIKK